MVEPGDHLRVALIAGTLGQGGAEKQLVYMVRALRSAGATVHIYALSRGEFYEAALQDSGSQVLWIGRSSRRVLRLLVLVRALMKFKPDIIQSSHTFTNIYAGIAGRLLNVPSVGSLRTNLAHTRTGNGALTRLQLGMTSVLAVNSQSAQTELIDRNLIDRRNLFLLPNVIDIAGLDEARGRPAQQRSGQYPGSKVILVARLIPVKRVDRFLKALSVARAMEPGVQGVVVGDGPERNALEKQAADLGLHKNGVSFAGRHDDVTGYLREATMMVLCSDHEGFPNVLLEAMAARLPIITTPAGDADTVVEHGVTGYVVPFDDVQGMANRIVQLSRSPELCVQLGEAGRRRVECLYNTRGLSERLFSMYLSVAQRHKNRRMLTMLTSPSMSVQNETV